MTLLEQYQNELASVRAAIMKLTADPTTSQSVSSANGGSFSASYLDIGKLHARENELITIIAELYRHTQGESGLSATYPIYC